MSWAQIIAAIKMGIVASAESVANIISGVTKVGNADKLDGYQANEFVFLQNFIAGNMGTKGLYYSTTVGKDCNDIDDFVALAGGADGLHYPTANNYYYIVTVKYNDTHKKQLAFGYKGTVIDAYLYRTCVEGVWSNWKSAADGGNADTLDGYHASSFALVANAQIKLFNGVEDIGVTADATLSDVWHAMPNSSVFVMDVNPLTDSSWNLPNKYGVITIVKVAAARGYVYFDSKDIVDGRYYMLLSSGGTPDGTWRKKADGGNADTVDGKHASDFLSIVGGTLTGTLVINPASGTYPYAKWVNAATGQRGAIASNASKQFCLYNHPEADTDSNANGNVFVISSADERLDIALRLVHKGTPYNVLHTGNSTKVIVSTTAPTDTTAVWIVPN